MIPKNNGARCNIDASTSEVNRNLTVWMEFSVQFHEFWFGQRHIKALAPKSGLYEIEEAGRISRTNSEIAELCPAQFITHLFVWLLTASALFEVADVSFSFL